MNHFFLTMEMTKSQITYQKQEKVPWKGNGLILLITCLLVSILFNLLFFVSSTDTKKNREDDKSPNEFAVLSYGYSFYRTMCSKFIQIQINRDGFFGFSTYDKGYQLFTNSTDAINALDKECSHFRKVLIRRTNNQCCLISLY